jgi:hypothetical protein
MNSDDHFQVDLHSLKVFYMDEAGYSLVMLPVEQDIKDAIHTAAKHLNRKYGMPITEVRFRVPYVIEQLEIQNNGTLLCILLSIQYCYS